MSLASFSPSFTTIFAQVTNAAAAGTPVNPVDAAAQSQPAWVPVLMYVLLGLMVYFVLIRPQMQAKKKTEETIKGAKTGDKIITSSGIHGLITNVKDTTVIVKVADNVKLEIEKSHIEKISRPDSDSDKPEKVVATKA
jgi:preprotein translocase subunit YajC